MTDEPQRSSGSGNGAIWALIVVLPLVYALSVGPVLYISNKLHASSSMMPAIDVFYAPLIWLYENTPLKGPLDAYLDWWEKMGRL